MYWWNVPKLAEDFQQGRVDEKERFKYYLATMIAWIALGQSAIFHEGSFKLVNLTPAAIVIIGAIVGITLCYRANKNGDNKDFIGRMVCLGWPIGIRLIMISIVVTLFWLLVIVISVVRELSPDPMAVAIAGIIISSLFPIFYYGMLYKYVNIVAQSHMVKDVEL